MTVPRPGTSLVTSLGVTLVAISCAAGSGSETPTPSPSAETSPTPSAEDRVLDAYEGMWTVVVEASREGETEPPALDDYAEGQAYELMAQALESAAEEEVTYTGDPVFEPEVISIEPENGPTSAEVEDCADGSAWLPNDAETNSRIESRRIEATASYDGLAWRISEMRIWEPGSC